MHGPATFDLSRDQAILARSFNDRGHAMSDAAELDRAVAERMGYPNTLRATGFDAGGIPIEVALVVPAHGGDRYAVVTHYDCNPDDECQGTSEFHGHPSLEEAERDYDDQVAGIAARLASGPSPR